MGVVEAIAIAGAVAAAASTGAEVYNQQQTRADAADANAAARKQKNEIASQQDATAQARVARMRQVAAVSSMRDQQTVASSPLGLTATQSGGGYGGSQPLKKLGA